MEEKAAEEAKGVSRMIVYEEEEFRQIRTDQPLLPTKPGDEGKDPLIEAIKRGDGTGQLFEFLLSALFQDVWEGKELANALNFIMLRQDEYRFLELFLVSHAVTHWFESMPIID